MVIGKGGGLIVGGWVFEGVSLFLFFKRKYDKVIGRLI